MSASRPKRVKIAPRTAPNIPTPLQQPGQKQNTRSHPVAPVSSHTRRTSNKRVRLSNGVEHTSTPRSQPTITAENEAQNPSPIVIDETDEDEDELEEVEIPNADDPQTPAAATDATGTLDTSVRDEQSGEEDSSQGQADVIRLELGGQDDPDKERRKQLALRKKAITSKDRAIRLDAHKMHVLALLASARIRNRWCSNMLLKARLLSLLPHSLQAAFNIPPSRFPDRAQRSRLFFDALQSLVDWWSQSFFDVSDPRLGSRTRPWEEIQSVVDTMPKLTRAHFFGSAVEQSRQMDLEEKFADGLGGERLRSANSLMKKVLQQEGSRDVMAQLFVSLARACGLGTRLVTSLQPVPWRAEKPGAKKKTGAGRGGRLLASRQGNGDGSEESDMEEVEIPPPEDREGGPGRVVDKFKGKRPTIRQAGRRRHQDPADVYRLRPPRPSKPTPSAVASKQREEATSDLSKQPPVFWADVFSRSDQRWIPVDPVNGIIRKKTGFEPVSDSGPIRMSYVVAFEEDGYARDVTPRYAKNFGAKTVKLRPPARKDEQDWWENVMSFLRRPYTLKRDELEDAELETSQLTEGMPLHMGGFKDHPIYALERHLKREEVILPKREIGRFRGEAVYRRSNVIPCKTAETWMRQGRRVKDRQEPLKWVNQRAVTLQKRRAQELAKQENGEAIQQGLYAEWQTEIYTPPPIQDGIIPQNSFGNIDLYAPSMLPPGAVHLPYKGIAKVAKAIGISYAEACTGFEFKKQRAIPVINGIVVAEENEDLVLEAYWESAAAEEEKERAKRETRALKRWAKLINGLRVRARLTNEYGGNQDLQEDQINPLADPAHGGPKGGRSAQSVLADAAREDETKWKELAQSLSPEPDPGVTAPLEEEV